METKAKLDDALQRVRSGQDEINHSNQEAQQNSSRVPALGQGYSHVAPSIVDPSQHQQAANNNSSVITAATSGTLKWAF